MNPDVPCRVSADLRAYQLREDRAPDEICDRCGVSLFGDKHNPKWQPSDEGWLVCPCGNALCEDCCGLIREAEEASGFQQWFGWETTHNEGFCSPGCMARLKEINWECKRARLRGHCDAAQADVDEAKRRELEHNDYGAIAALSVGLVTLIARVREICR